MESKFSVDCSSPTAHIEIQNYLINQLTPILNKHRPIIFICIGTDRSTGDSLGPLIGYKLKHLSKDNIHIYGNLSEPIHAKNLSASLDTITSKYENPYIIAIDSSLGSLDNVGKIFIEEKPLSPGLALNKKLPSVGELSITGIVNISTGFEFLVLQNTRLFTVMSLADVISKGIYNFSLKCDSLNRYSKNILSK